MAKKPDHKHHHQPPKPHTPPHVHPTHPTHPKKSVHVDDAARLSKSSIPTHDG